MRVRRREGIVARLSRGRLTEAVAGTRSAAIIAPSGWGKSVLAEDVAAHLGLATVVVDVPARALRDATAFVGGIRRALIRAGLRAMSDALAGSATDPDATVDSMIELLRDRDEAVLLVVDEVQNVPSTAGVALRRLVSELPAPHRILICGQQGPDWLGSECAVVVGVAELAFDGVEIGALARSLRRSLGWTLDPADATTIADSTGGWPAAVLLALETATTDRSALARGLEGLVQRMLNDAGPKVGERVAALCSVPLLSEPVAAVLGGSAGAGGSDGRGGADALADLSRTGIPLRQRADGWLEVPDAIRAVASRGYTVPSADLAAVAGAYFDAGIAQVAINFLVERGSLDALVETLASRRWQELQEFEPAELRSLAAILPPALVAERPRLLLVLARVSAAASEVAWRGELLEQAASASAAVDDPVLAREIDAERAALAALHGDVERVASLADSVLSEAGRDEVSTRARALAALGRARAFEREPAAVSEAERVLTDAATLARLAGERELLAATLLTLGYAVHFARGDLAAAAKRLREAADAAPTTGRARASILTFLSDALMYAGELDEADAVLREVAETGRRLRDQGILGYHAWMKSAIASRRRDSESLVTWMADAERHPGDWFGHPTGIEFLAEAVDWCGRVGDHETAARYLARVEERCAADGHEGVDQISVYARATHSARFGDAAEADTLLVAVLAGEQLPPRESWRMHLLRGLAALRRGEESAAASHSARAFEEAAALGHAELPWIHEPDAVELLLPVARKTRSASVRSVDRATPALAVRVLGDFAVTADGRPADPPPGRPQMLVKLLAVSGRTIALDEAIEILWPEVDPDVGRARMRNVLTRVRQVCGELVVRDGSGLALDDDVVVDGAEFEREARAALASQGDDMVALARRAVTRYAGELLPADRYDDYTVSARERLAQLYLSLLDRLAADAERAGDVDEALSHYGAAISASPLDEYRYERAAALALSAGRRQRAADVIDQARRMLAELDVQPSPALAEIAREIEGLTVR